MLIPLSPLVTSVGEASVKLLKGELGFPEATSVGGKGVDFKSYPGMGHSTSPEEIKHIGAWCVPAYSMIL